MKKLVLSFLISACLYSVNVNAQILRQEQSMWCLAACIQSALGQANVNQTQAQIVARLTGYPYDRPANFQEVISVLNSYGFRAWNVNVPATPQQLYQSLSTGWKIIAFVNPTNNPQIGHFIMLQGFTPNGQIKISDPATGATYFQDLNTLYYAWNWRGSIVVGTPHF